MSKNEKTLLGGILIGAALATTAICFAMKKCTQLAEAHLFNMENQEGAQEKIDELIPNEAPAAPEGEL